MRASAITVALLCLMGQGAPVYANAPPQFDTPKPASALQVGLSAYAAGEDETAARTLFPLAIDGDPRAQRVIGDMYDEGRFFQRDPCTALVWYDRAARNGEARAMHYLANAYIGGEGVRQDPILGYLWASLAEEIGESGAWSAKRVALLMMTDEMRAEAIRRLDTFDPTSRPPIEFYPMPADWALDTEMLRRLADRGLAVCARPSE